MDTPSVLSLPPATPVETPVAVGIRYGLFTALVWIITDVVLRVTGLSFKMFSVYLPASLLITVTGMVMAHREYKSRNRYLSWKEAFIIGVVLMLVSSIIAQTFNWLYVNFIDPDYPSRFRANMQAWMESFPNMPQERLDEAMADMSDEKMKSIVKSFKNAGMGIVFGSVLISALVALFTKRQPAEFE